MPLSMQTKSLKMQFSFFGPGLGIMRKASQNILITGPAILDNLFVLLEVYFSHYLCFSLGSIEWFLLRLFCLIMEPLPWLTPYVFQYLWYSFIYLIHIYFCWAKKNIFADKKNKNKYTAPKIPTLYSLLFSLP